MIKKEIFYFLLSIVLFSCSNNSPQYLGVSNTETICNRIDSFKSLLQPINAYYIAIINVDSVIKEIYGGKNINGEAFDKLTIMEMASLSKTFFASLYWQLSESNKAVFNPFYALSDSNLYFPKSLLSHSGINNNQKNPHFKYSDSGYILLQKHLEEIQNNGLENIAQNQIFEKARMKSSSFIWRNYSNYVNGFEAYDKQNQVIRQYNMPFANGTLYSNATDFTQFVSYLLKQPSLDSMAIMSVKIENHKQLYWGAGMGIEQQKNNTYLWQWGNNWAYNHILIIDKEKKIAFLAMCNTIVGAKQLRFFTNKVFNTEFELFNFINWY